MNKILERLGKIGIIPVIKIDDPEKAVPLAKALIEGGIPCAEVTFRTAQGEEAIRRISAEVPNILLGAGTVLTTAQVEKAVSAGAAFIVSPGFNPKVVAHCIERAVPVTPGCSNPSDIEQALEMGLDVVKFFPAEQTGGLDYIKAVAAPYPGIKFIPTGGVNASNIVKYTAYEKVLACGGSWMVQADLINAGDFSRITALCREAVLSMLGFSFVHIGLNAANEEEAQAAAKLFETLFGLNGKAGGKSIFAGDNLEIMKNPGPGTRGHIGIGTWNVPKAYAYLERQGIAFDPDSVRLDGKGEVNFAYLKDEILGFAVHIVQKK
ncbi:MAG: bifunctional 4-hydroxy-2-oxoglutarate aldolase/2-dehydro-3-deoxy-phosphogluconate aldolase [Treponema sp.]|nr:bifunctional 4-hydroxy-2-oxoglutarate aldolase/2-dehydro-3-deoxy-phosphogluconate aldolase [Treponema sp.]